MRRTRSLTAAILATVVTGALVATSVPASAVDFLEGYHSPTVAGDSVIFAGYAPGKGVELFTTDGTAAGTVLVKDIYPGAKSSMPFGSQIGETRILFTPIGDKTFFFAKDATGVQLWVTDGTSAGTTKLTSGTQGSIGAAQGTAFNGEFYFASNSRTTGVELWKSDGTLAGTTLVRDFEPQLTAEGKHISSYPMSFHVSGDYLYFLTRQKNGDNILNSTTDGFTFTPVINLGYTVNHGIGILRSDATELNGNFVFRNDSYIYSTNGTTATKLYPYVASTMFTELVAFDGSIFTTSYKSNGYNLARLTGSTLTDLGVANVQSISVAQGKLWYVTYDAASKTPTLWTLETATSTPVNLGPIGKWSSQFVDLTLIERGDSVYFWSYLGLWESDGTPAGTHLAVDFGFGRGLVTGMNVALLDDTFILAGEDSAQRGSIWASDATVDGTTQLRGQGAFAAPAPTITGTPTVGTKLAGRVGTWKPAATALSYQWKLDGVPIEGATGKYFTIPEGTTGAITFAVTGKRNSFQTLTKTSAAKVVARQFELAPVPTITGDKVVGTYLRAVPGEWSPAATFSYQWYSAGKAIGGATRSTYKVSSTTVKKSITVKVTGKATGYVNTNRSSLPR